MNKIRNILIIEDEKYAAERLKVLLNEIAPEFKIISVLSSIKESINFFKHSQVDLIFMDINLSDGYSFDIFDQVDINTPIIFTTAYDEFALKAFKVNSIDYLLKPLKKNELAQAINKLQTLEESIRTGKYHALIQDIKSDEQPTLKKRFLISFGNKLKTIKTKDIAYFFAKDKAVYLVTFNDRKYPMGDTLDALEKQVNNRFFFRINRKFLIHIESISDISIISSYRVKLKLKPESSEEILVSGSKTKSFREWLEQ
ncbi:MAG: LytTR family DNA-binding domain-containing protein [Bacteroidales bacterium]|nr:LytTR family DNA-binding domain-containing protein [Bacteroidales bacterium]